MPLCGTVLSLTFTVEEYSPPPGSFYPLRVPAWPCGHLVWCPSPQVIVSDALGSIASWTIQFQFNHLSIVFSHLLPAWWRTKPFSCLLWALPLLLDWACTPVGEAGEELHVHWMRI